MTTCFQFGNNADMTETLLTSPEVADLFGVSDETVRRWAKDGKLPVVELPSGRVKFRRSDIDAILAPTPVVDPAA